MRSRSRTSRWIRAIPHRLFVAALGHPYGPNEERGIFRSTDGGRTFEKVLYKDENTGGNDVDIDPSNPDIVYATLWEERQGPWENAVWAGTGGGIFKSTDGGATWKPLTDGLPQVIQANLAISPANPKRIFAAVAGADRTGNAGRSRGAQGMYRSDDAGRDVDDDHAGHASDRPHRRRRSADAAAAPERSGYRAHGEHRVVEVNRRRHDVGAIQGCAGRRGLSERLDQSRQPRHHAASASTREPW